MPFSRFAAALLVAVVASHAAALPSPGWRADLQTHFHGVTGVVTVVDQDTLRIDDFYFDGGGIDVYFYLGAENTTASFTSGLEVGPQLFGMPFDGTSLTIDLPAGQTIDGWNAISVWCTAVNVSFGDAAFTPPPTLPGDYNSDGSVDAADYTVWRDSENQTGAGLPADGDGDGTVDTTDYTVWADNYAGGVAAAVPEPTAAMLTVFAAAIIACRRFHTPGSQWLRVRCRSGR